MHSTPLAPSTPSSRLSLDGIDTQIVNFLQQDGRMAFTEIAKRVGVAESTIRNRAQRLIDSGSIKIQAYLNPDKLGFRRMALVQLKISDLTQADELAQRLTQLESVSYVAIVAGRCDIHLEFAYDTLDDLLDFLTFLRSQSSVVDSETIIVLKLLKTQYSFQVSQYFGNRS
jgi:Lrp/AsnC family transcriptional regulator, regulator for asnA, asnC and gidA